MSEADAFVERLDGRAGSPDRAAVAPRAAPRRVVRSRHRDRDFALRRVLLAADLFGIWLAALLALTLFGARAMPLTDSFWVLPTLPAWALLFRAYGLYRRPTRRFEPTHLDDLSSLFHAMVIGTLGLWCAYKLAPIERLDWRETLSFALVALPLVALLRGALRVVNLRLRGPERVFAVGTADDVTVLRGKLERHPEYEMALVGAAAAVAENGNGAVAAGPPAEQLEDLEALLASGQVDHVIVRLDADFMPQERVRALMHACHREGVRFGYFPGTKGLLTPGVDVNNLEGMGVMTCHPPVLARGDRAIKRGVDLLGAGLGLVVLSPLLAAIAAAIALDSKGGVLYRQRRVGKDGRRFEMLKFRTMVQGADGMDDELMRGSVDPDWLVLERDPRITRVGRLLRCNSFDELPQLWNVLRGEMSLVGPRPLSERDDCCVRGWRRHRLDIQPGITGYWQVLGRNDIPFREMLQIDYAYIAGWSLWQDVKLLARTFPVVIRRRGAN